MNDAVHIIDDDETIRDALAFLFASRGIAAVVWPSGQAFLNAWPIPDCGCIILDVRMDGLSGPQVFDRLRAAGGGVPVIFLTGHADVPLAVQSLKAGAFDFVEKPFSDNAIVDVAITALRFSAGRRAELTARETLDQRLSTLSQREREVMDLMLTGSMNKQISDQLGIAMRTVEVHRSKVLSKMGARNVAELAAILAGGRG